MARAANGLDWDRLATQAERHRDAFLSALPFPHVVIDDFLPESAAEALAADFQKVEGSWKSYVHVNEKKFALTDRADMPCSTRAAFDAFLSPEFVRFVGRLTGKRDLIADPSLEGAGMHAVRRGGFLNVHADFLTHTKKRCWSRQVNLLIYLNRDWQPEWRGHLELWNRDLSERAHSIEPRFNRCVAFETGPDSYHGHPSRLVCPKHVTRKSLALYYYRDEGTEGALAATHYRALPGDALPKRLAIAADRALLSLYTYLKGRTGLSDRMVSKLLRRLSDPPRS